MTANTLALALRQALIQEMKRDDRVVLLGEDIGILGGAYTVTAGLMEMFGEDRVRDTPISETAIVGAAIGAAMTGLRPVVEIQFNDFLTCAMDQICNQAAKLRFMMGGQVTVPIVVRAPCGAAGRAAQHSQSLEAWFMHTPGLKVVYPSTPYDAKGLLKSAIRDDNPVMFFEHKMLYGARSPGGKSQSAIGNLTDVFTPAPDDDYAIPFGVADIKRAGKDITIVATGHMLHLTIQAALILEKEGINVEVIDPRTLVPLDTQTILKSVEKTSRLVIVSEDVLTCGVASEISAMVAEYGLFDLASPIRRIAVPDTPIPFAPVMERAVIPQTEQILNVVRELLESGGASNSVES
jgi:acetoin:2,6-dichlorophenolindophenol oxidoreductase subunit beta